LERHRQDREAEAQRRQDLAEHTGQRRQRARRARQELDSSTPEYGIVSSCTRCLSEVWGD
jgi:hypothetical protein